MESLKFFLQLAASLREDDIYVATHAGAIHYLRSILSDYLSVCKDLSAILWNYNSFEEERGEKYICPGFEALLKGHISSCYQKLH